MLYDPIEPESPPENAVNQGIINYPLLNEQDILLENIRKEKSFKTLMERVKYEWENFEI